MNIETELNQMTIEEKLRAMELLWDDLCHNNADFASPGWHKNVLEERENRIKDGSEEILDWEEAKKHLRDSD